jgi:hypothetical protein
MKIIVARYNENIEWSKKFMNVIVYNKGEKLIEGYNEIMLDNVGKEGHTYYKYISDNYENLDNFTIFLQGHPFDHSPNIMERLDIIFKENGIKTDFEFLCNRILDCNMNGQEGDLNENGRRNYNLPLLTVYDNIFNVPDSINVAMDFQFGAGGQFIVSKEQILKRPKLFYDKIVDLLKNEINPIEGYVIERFHKLIFS